MAIAYENECCGCATSSYPCLGDACRNRHVPHIYCDKCMDDVDEVWDVDGDHLCRDCLHEHFHKITLEKLNND